MSCAPSPSPRSGVNQDGRGTNIDVGQDTGEQHKITDSLNLDMYKYIVEAARKLDMREPPSHLNGTKAFVKDYEAIRAQTR